MMKSRRRPLLEGLEGRSLLSGLSATLTESAPTAQPGQPIVFTLQETNTSTQPITVDEGPSLGGFTIQQGNRTIWESNAGIQPMFVMARTLQPGESLTLSATWDGEAQDGSAPAAGTYTVFNQMAPQATETVTVGNAGNASTRTSPSESTPRPIAPISTAAPSDPPTATPSPAPVQSAGQSPIVLTVSTDRLRYAKGHRVRLTAYLHNDGSTAVTLPMAATRGFAVREGKRAIWRDVHILAGAGAITVQPGQTIEYAAGWNGRAHPRGLPVRPGTYSVDASADGFTASTTFVVGGPVRHRA